MWAPKFWNNDGTVPRALQPLAWAYGSLGRLRWTMAKPYRLGIPVICIGNLVAGGAGKTPTALAVERFLARYPVAGSIPVPAEIKKARLRRYSLESFIECASAQNPGMFMPPVTTLIFWAANS